MAKAFKFELQDVLEFRNLEKEQAQNELAKALAVETQIQNDLQTIAAQFLSVQKQLDSYTDFEDIAAGNRRKVLLDLQKEELLKQLSQAKIVSDEKRAVLDEIMKKTTALEKLKEKQLESWKEEADREEEAFIDDLANSGTRFHQ
ncbi:MAG: flagellar export protein FliJ [Treponema sp.]|nr:flagellar export protein FliJ [Treponema sp.]